VIHDCQTYDIYLGDHRYSVSGVSGHMGDGSTDSNTTLGTDISACHSHGVRSVAWSYNASWLVSVLHEVRSMVSSHNARWLASVLHDGTAKI
jgi:hypothetical protein